MMNRRGQTTGDLAWNRRGARRAAWLGLCALAALGWPPVPRSSAAEPAAPTKSVRLVIDFGDGVEWHFKELPWRDGLTGLDVLQAAQAHPRGIQLEFKGGGARALVTKINGLANQGGGAQARNWLYWVDSRRDKPQRGEVGVGAHQPAPGETILWKFTTLDTTEED